MGRERSSCRVADPHLSDADLRVRFFVFDRFVRDGHPPSAADAARDLRIPEADARASFQRLHDAHAIVLRHGDKSRVRVAHPLSAYPTPFWVTTPRGAWWGNCMWDSLAIPAMLKCDATIQTTSGAMSKHVVFQVRDGALTPSTGVVHIPLPARQWWDDVDFTCGNLLYFQSEADVDPWLERTGNPLGQVVPVETMWRLAQAWYGNRLDPHWRPRTPDESEAILSRFGLGGEFWSLHG